MTAPRGWTRELAEAHIRVLDGRDLQRSLDVARAIIDAGLWRSWMARAFMRVHRGEVTRLMKHLGPMIPPSATPARALPPEKPLPEPLDGRSVDHSVAAAARWMRDGLWEGWMVRALLHLHRGEESLLMRRLGPTIGFHKQERARRWRGATTTKR